MQESVSPEPKKEYLETHRFKLSSDTKRFLGPEWRWLLHDLGKKHPELRAIAFFGSRIRGKERTKSELEIIPTEEGRVFNGTEVSDLDVIAFYDKDLITDKSEVDSRLRDVEMQISSFPFALAEQRNVANRPDFNTNIIDISREQTEKDLASFKEEILNSRTNLPLKVEFDLSGEAPFYSLASRFLLSVGDIYQARQAVFDDFAKEKNGEMYWKVLMRVLSLFERPQHDHHSKEFNSTCLVKYAYPQTLAEGREYFLKLRNNEARE
jgi:hypothetical protein